jgi:hypothetical protein
MNTIDLLDKLNFASIIGLQGDQALQSQKIIMDAYLSAVSAQPCKKTFGQDTAITIGVNAEVSLNQLSADIVKPNMSFNLFNVFKDDLLPAETIQHTQSNQVMLAANNSRSSLDQLYQNNKISTEAERSNSDHVDTESDSYTKHEMEQAKKTAPKIGRKKSQKANINEIISEERRRLIRKLESSTSERIVFQKRFKNSKKDPKISADNYRGSRFWGVSKNKSKWQVMITLNHFKEYKGGFDNEESAARFYDKKSICTFGLKAKTNFTYSKVQVEEILQMDESIIM